MQVIELPPIAPTLIESTRAIGYSLEAAIADIVDNSIAACATNVKIKFFPLQGAYISILDDGTGMDASEITSAMQYGSQNPLVERSEGDLGRFGLGLKTASLSQCRMLTVASKKNNSIEIRRWDIDFVQQTGAWSLQMLSEPDEISSIPNIEVLAQMTSGTLVVWQKLDRMESGCVDFAKSMGRQIDVVREHLALVYHRYLSGEPGIKKLTISINDENLIPADPFLIKKSDQTMQEETYIIHGAKIQVQPYILPHVSMLSAAELKSAGGKEGLRKLQGFYVYRNKRLLIWGTWFKMMRKGELSKLARIRVDIPNTLDNLWTLDIKKSSAIPPEEVRENLVAVIDNIGNKSKVKFTKRGKLETDDKDIHLWNRMRTRDGGYYYEINRQHPLVLQLASHLGEGNTMLNAVLTQIEKSLPLNQLYIDLNGDEKIANDQFQKDKEIIECLRSMLSADLNGDQKLEFLDKIESFSPYKEHSEAIEKLKKEILKNEREKY